MKRRTLLACLLPAVAGILIGLNTTLGSIREAIAPVVDERFLEIMRGFSRLQARRPDLNARLLEIRVPGSGVLDFRMEPAVLRDS